MKKQPVPSSDVTDTKVGANSDVTNKYDVIVTVDKFRDLTRSLGSESKEIYSYPKKIPQWNSWVRGMVVVYGDGRVAIGLYHHPDTDLELDVKNCSPQLEQLSLQTSVVTQEAYLRSLHWSSTTMEVKEVVEYKTRGSHLAERGRYWVGGQFYHPVQKGWGDSFTVKISLTL